MDKKTHEMLWEAKVAVALMLNLVWHDKRLNACGVNAGAAAECHAIEKAWEKLKHIEPPNQPRPASAVAVAAKGE